MASYLHALALRALRQAHVAVPRAGARFEPAPGQAESTEPIDLEAGLAHEPPVTGRRAEGDAGTGVETRFEPPVEPPFEIRSQRAAPSDERADPPQAPAGRLLDADAGVQGPPGPGPHLPAAAPADRPSPRPSRRVSIAEREHPSPGELGPAPSAAALPPPSAARMDARPATIARVSLAGEPTPRPEAPEPQTTERHEGPGASSRNDPGQANVAPASVVERRSEARPTRPDRPAPTDDAPGAAPAASAALASTRVASLAVPRAPTPAPPSIAATTTTTTTTAPARRDRHAQAAPTAPSIHVTIGRIEIRNDAAAAAPAVRERPAAPPRSSLQHYLQSRGNGRAA